MASNQPPHADCVARRFCRRGRRGRRCRSLCAGAVRSARRCGSKWVKRCRAAPMRWCRSTRVNVRGDRAEVVAAVAPGEGVLAAGRRCCTPARRCAGPGSACAPSTSRSSLLPASPEVRVRVAVHPHCRRRTLRRRRRSSAALDLLAHAVAQAGWQRCSDAREDEEASIGALTDDRCRRGDRHRRHRQRTARCSRAYAWQRLGRVEAHGIAVSPGETAAFGFVGATAGAAHAWTARCGAWRSGC